MKGSINGPYEPPSRPNNQDMESGTQLGGRDASVVVHIKRATEVRHNDLEGVSVRSFQTSRYPDTTLRRKMIHHHPTQEVGRRNCQSIPLNIQTHKIPHPVSVPRSFPSILYLHVYRHPFPGIYYVFLHGASRPSSYGFFQIYNPLSHRLFPLLSTIRLKSHAK